MSANNEIIINKRTLDVRDVDSETGFGNIVGTGKDLKDAIEIAERYMEENIVEYGIRFVSGQRDSSTEFTPHQAGLGMTVLARKVGL